ncbi:MAG: CPBP family intramembrane glutamic endopeptidase [Planctomycetota bacterium]
MKKIWEGLKTVDRDSAIALLYTGINLTTLEFFYLSSYLQRQINIRDGTYRRTTSFEAGAGWAIATTVAQLVIPILLIKFVHRRKLRDHGWRFDGFFRHMWVYLACFAFMAPFVYYASTQPEFARRYPFVAEARTDPVVWWQWQAVYLMQFLALESFFRGYLLFTLERSMKWNACFVMAVPYCMIHFHKPAMECYGALIAGVVLGMLALRFRSFYGGALLHMMVAVMMDALGYTGPP